MTEATKLCFDNPFNPVTHTAFGRSVTAACELFERTTRRYQKPTFGLSSTVIDGKAVRINEEVVWAWPFCNLLHFRKELHQLQQSLGSSSSLPCRAITPPYFGAQWRQCSHGATSTSPIGSMPPWCPPSRARSISTTT